LHEVPRKLVQMNQSKAIKRILHSVGLEREHTTLDYMWPAVGLVASGLVVGAGLALIFGPRRGVELRAGIRHRVGAMLPGHASSSADEKPLEDMSRDELYALARQQDIEGRSSMSKRELAENLAH
jgi:gas vesicle protein